ncbi:conserved Plasmodium protein, unknown function [Plasmodium malariae]|uniref:Uncharacterized protein n=1 Tax=Plasmodium malariae TaxID=5858 RepID=A0A1C3KCF7_PLAMA|nr:conserved Plasmodium protein, unknown function [Plasmodium malariae]SBT71269.1 conserved Plasmodium protein, unknown function [Plasmodium malariae]SCN12689.1 conserved Plasmodium protein, unknown function [Plasmodium malariae]
MSYNKNYGGQFMGLRQSADKNDDNKLNDQKLQRMFKKNDKKNAEKVIFSLSELRGINIPEIQDGEIYFFCTVIFDNDEVKVSMEKSNHNSSLVLGQYLHEYYTLEFNEEIVLNIPENSNFVRCYVSCLTVTNIEGQRNIKLEGIGYTDPYKIKECHVYPYTRCKLNTALGAVETKGTLKMCVKCVDRFHPSEEKEMKPFNVIEEFKKRLEE